MKKIVLSAAAAALSLVAAPAFADEMPRVLGADSYTASLGYTHYDADGAQTPTITARLGARFNSYFGVEAEASVGMDEDEVSATAKEGLAYQYGVFGVGMYPVTEKFDLIARAGYTLTDTQRTDWATGSQNDTDGGFSYGLGAQYFLTDTVAVRGDWTRTDSRDDKAATADALTLSIVGKF